MFVSRIHSSIALVIAVLLVSGCSGKKSVKVHERHKEELSDAARSYNEHLRWGHVEKAIEYIAPPDRKAFIAAHDGRQGEVRITDVRVGVVDFPRGATEATVTVTRSFYKTNELQERTETLLQTWQLRDGRWLVVTPPTPAPK